MSVYRSILVTVGIVFVVTLWGMLLVFKNQEQPDATVVNYPKLVAKTLPPEVKQELKTASPAASLRVPILLYHYVEIVKDKNDTIRKSLALTPTTVEKQIQTLLDDGYTFLTLAELADILDGKKEAPEKPVVLTFDDGYGDFYTDVFPLLKKYQVRVTAYIVPGFLNHLNYMTTKNVEEIANSGLVELGAHTVHHTYLKGVKENVARKEIVDSKKMLEEKFGVSVVSFAYPYGAFDKQAMQLVEEAGFKTAVTTVLGIQASVNNRYFLFRIRSGARVGNDLIHYLEKTEFKH